MSSFPSVTALRFILSVVLASMSFTMQGAEIPATDARIRAALSHYNWAVRGDAIASSIGGASISVKFSGTRKVALRVDTSAFPGKAASTYPILAWQVNGGAVQTHQLAAGDSSLVLAEGVADPVIELFIKGMSPWEDRWTGDLPPNSVKITGFTVDDGAVAEAVPQPEKIWLNIGDSILAGDAAAYAEGQGRPKRDEWAASDDARASYGWLLARHFGHREARIAFGGYNWGGGLGKVPDLATVIEQRVTSPAPAVVLVNLGTNGKPTDEQVIAALRKLRQRCGAATKIFVMIPVSGAARAEVTRAFKTWQTATPDAHAHLIDLGKVTFATADKVHPTTAGHQAIFKAVLPEVERVLGPAVGDDRTAKEPEPAAAAPVSKRQPTPGKPNILVIVTDQQFAEVMSCRMGREHIHTPALDSLAAQGTSFTRAYCVFPLCGPSRNSMFTGLYPQQLRWKPVHDSDWSIYLGRYLLDAGYDTAYSGKSELRGKEIALHGFQSILAPQGGPTRIEAMQNGGWDAWAAGEAVKFIAQPRDEPFLLVASFLNPHNICEWSRRLAGQKQDLDCGEIGEPPPLEKLPPAPANLAPQRDEPDAMTLMQRSYQAGSQFPVGGYTADEWRRHRWGYYRMVELVDHQIGRLLAALRTAGLEEDTLILFTSDHGECAGAHGWNQKSVPYDESTRVPFILSWKGRTQPGTSDKLINTGIDLVPTLLAAAGVDQPAALPGRNALPFVLGQTVGGWREEVISQMSMSQGAAVDGFKPSVKWWMLRSVRYKYCLFSHGVRRESLVDMQADPMETINLATDPAHRAALLDHRERLARYGREHQDKGVALSLAHEVKPIPFPPGTTPSKASPTK